MSLASITIDKLTVNLNSPFYWSGGICKDRIFYRVAMSFSDGENLSTVFCDYLRLDFAKNILNKLNSNVDFCLNILRNEKLKYTYHTEIDCNISIIGALNYLLQRRLISFRTNQKTVNKLRLQRYASSVYYSDKNAYRYLLSCLRVANSNALQFIKVKVGLLSVSKERERLIKIRNKLKPHVKIAVDANCSYSLDQAIRFCRVNEDLDIAWIEEPFVSCTIENCKEFKNNSSIPLAFGENWHNKECALPFINNNLVDIIQPNIFRIGSVSDFADVVEAALSNSIRVYPHGWGGQGISEAVEFVINHFMELNYETGLLCLEYDVTSDNIFQSINNLTITKSIVSATF